MKTTLQYFIFAMKITTSISVFASEINQPTSLFKKLDQSTVKHLRTIHSEKTQPKSLLNTLDRNALEYLKTIKTTKAANDTVQKNFIKLFASNKTIYAWCNEHDYEITMDNTELLHCGSKKEYLTCYRNGSIKIVRDERDAFEEILKEWNSIRSSDHFSRELFAQKLINYGVLTKRNTLHEKSNHDIIDNYIQAILTCINIKQLSVNVPNAVGSGTSQYYTETTARNRILKQFHYLLTENKIHCKNETIYCGRCALKAVNRYRNTLKRHGLIKMDS